MRISKQRIVVVRPLRLIVCYAIRRIRDGGFVEVARTSQMDYPWRTRMNLGDRNRQRAICQFMETAGLQSRNYDLGVTLKRFSQTLVGGISIKLPPIL